MAFRLTSSKSQREKPASCLAVAGLAVLVRLLVNRAQHDNGMLEQLCSFVVDRFCHQKWL